MAREESFPIPLRYIDVAGTTSTTLDVMLERRVDDYWHIEGNQDLSDAWTSHGSPYWMKNLQTDIPGLVERLTKKQTTSRPDYLWPEIRKDMPDAAQRKEKQKWAIEKTEARQCKKVERYSFHLSIQQVRSSRKL